ncbi:Menaquinone reductase, multiheme cytochrome c subunit [Pseudodesulfovibrio profundus]|uniref:Menaquinone reductase, multiheme cytochrome c subunit n=1 Tax=Pseudodesulfovibrio profundus TaxID=57320 RepID=A0A2C8F5T7_9BACT|nr:cytochrome c3 family protein [Pseudodesulfovibrio profundus]SOB57966.1 Menaquinone reductase, multiheme cytochrome c subunit [Pseudodesulfovibrio profundus]
MEERKASKRCGGAIPFIIGFLATCVLGWAVIPGMFYEDVEQPIWFSHAIHVEGEGMDCESCHYFRDDGSYTGFPTNEVCAECHAVDPEEAMESIVEEGIDPNDYEAIMQAELGAIEDNLLSADEDALQAEREYVVKYLIQGKEVPWLTYQYQPDNVYFSHKAHENLDIAELAEMKKELSDVVDVSIFDEPAEQNCNLCHLKDIGVNDQPPAVERNILSGYSKMTMKMWKCERCHALKGQSNACFTCHK